MSRIEKHIEEYAVNALRTLLPDAEEIPDVVISPTRKEFEGDFTIVVFPFTRLFKKKPEEIAQLIGEEMSSISPEIVGYNVVKGFLNLKLDSSIWASNLDAFHELQLTSSLATNGKKVMVEFSSPNTNKPLHLGHIRNILLGWSTCQILEAAGYEVIKTQIVNDRGIAICKSMLAWQKFGEGKTPDSENVKGDHFVGQYYVLFEAKFQEEYLEWQSTSAADDVFSQRVDKEEDRETFFKSYKNNYFNKFSTLGREARLMLQSWENGDPKTVDLWRRMNDWVYGGFDETYGKLGVDFDKIYHESETYLLGKAMVEEGLKKKVFYPEADGSVWADLSDVGMDKKIVLRSDGTSVYITQDLGTAQVRYEEFGMDKAVYVVADEQDYHFQVLFELLKRLGKPFANDLHHLNYGMVDLPTGKMKSREGTVVDADDLIADVIDEARKGAGERGELDGLTKEEQEDIYRKIGMGALKFFILKVNPKRRMTFDPKESVDMQGQTGPYIQNAYVRIQSVLNKRAEDRIDADIKSYTDPSEIECDIVKELYAYPDRVIDAAENLDPSEIANYLYNLAKQYHRFYHDHRILTAESEEAKVFRLRLSECVAETLAAGMRLLGIEMPQKM